MSYFHIYFYRVGIARGPVFLCFKVADVHVVQSFNICKGARNATEQVLPLTCRIAELETQVQRLQVALDRASDRNAGHDASGSTLIDTQPYSGIRLNFGTPHPFFF